jgi:hypothetical protein
MNAPDYYQYEASRKDLAAGILKQAALDLRRFQAATRAQLLNLPPETVHGKVLGELSLGTFGYWSRRCGRAARRLKHFLSNIFTNEHTANAAEPVTSAHALH